MYPKRIAENGCLAIVLSILPKHHNNKTNMPIHSLNRANGVLANNHNLILKLLPSDYMLPMLSNTTCQSIPNGCELSSSDFALFGQNWVESTYLIVDSTLCGGVLSLCSLIPRPLFLGWVGLLITA
ncbi:MAG: hypothetical protein [Inoviridae sp.]|nr:MAG: hypothetical protein [Inoviridae sp.]